MLAAMSDAFAGAILRGDRATALEQARRGLLEKGLVYVYEELVTPALEEVGELWEHNRVSVADEHVASAVAQATIAALYPDVCWPTRGPKALVAAVGGEQHCIGPRMTADLLALDGWADVYLGADVPPGSLADRARDESAVLVALSATLPGHLPALRETVRALREVVPHAKILVGGRAVRDLPDAAELGADAIAPTAHGGVDASRRFKP
jgi:methanogenic corrinoid protein MtbC1